MKKEDAVQDFKHPVCIYNASQGYYLEAVKNDEIRSKIPMFHGAFYRYFHSSKYPLNILYRHISIIFQKN